MTLSIILILLLISLVGLHVTQTWQNKILWMAIQYGLVFVLVAQSWPWSTAAAKLLTGWASLFIISITLTAQPLPRSQLSKAERGFYGLITLSIGLLAAFAARQMPDWLPDPNIFVLSGGFMLMSAHLIYMGLREDTLNITLGLLGWMAGFEIIYAAIETSLLLNVILSALTLMIALTGAYLLAQSTDTESRP